MSAEVMSNAGGFNWSVRTRQLIRTVTKRVCKPIYYNSGIWLIGRCHEQLES
jgi:hypothetical protein